MLFTKQISNQDQAHYYTTPGLSWDSTLKMTKVKLELLGNIDMHLMIEKGKLCFLFRNKIIKLILQV